jgi:putative transposase
MERHRLGEDKKNSSWLGAYLIFIDESGFMLTPSVRKTWAPVGCTPLIRHHFSNDRISVISGISVSPTRKRLGLFGMFFWDNIAQEEVVAFLHEVLRHLRGHVIALMDNSNTHKGNLLQHLCQRFPRLHLEYFPAYAPDLNPDEAVWGLLKGKLGNGRPDDLQELAEQLQGEFRSLAQSQPNLRGCIRQSELLISLP